MAKANGSELPSKTCPPLSANVSEVPMNQGL
jgi:hypothetical protein